MDKIEMNLTLAKVFVTTRYHYGSKTIVRKWLNLIHYKNMDEFNAACRDLNLKGQESKWMYLDYEHIISVYISHQWISPEIFSLIRHVAELTVTEQEAFTAWLDYHRPDLATISGKRLIKHYQKSLQGIFKNKESFAILYAKEYLNITPKNTPAFDWRGYANKLFSEQFHYINGRVYSRVSF